MIEAQHQPEAAAQRRAHKALARGGADGREVRDGQRVRARARPGADQDVDPEVLQCRVEHLLDVRHQAVDLVDEEDLPAADLAEDSGEVDLLLEDGAGGLFEADLQLGRDDGGQRGLAQAGRAVEQDVVHGVAPPARGLDGDGEVLLELGLAGELVELPRAQAGLEELVLVLRRGGSDAAVPHENTG